MIVLDTNIIIGRLKADKQIIRILDTARTNEESFAISVITELELFAHPALQDKDVIHIERLLRTLHAIKPSKK